jgi:hypothetical protein
VYVTWIEPLYFKALDAKVEKIIERRVETSDYATA